MTIEEESKVLASTFIEKILKVKGIDFTPHYDKISKDIEDYVFNGNWDHTIDVEDSNFPNIRVIEENEYDQHMDEDDSDTPAWDDIIDVGGYYLHVV